MLFPVGHEDTVVRRLPWVSIGLFVVCVAMQAYAARTSPDLEIRALEISHEMQAIEDEVVHENFLRVHPDFAEKHRQLMIDTMSRGGTEKAMEEAIRKDANVPYEKFKNGELTGKYDVRYIRYQELKLELERLEDLIPSLRFGYRPALDGFGSMLSSVFAHQGWLHLITNMWFLYLVGVNLEDRWGRLQFLLFYLTAGCIAALGFRALHPDEIRPLIGASGAVAGAMGAFMICFGRTKVKVLYLYFFIVSPHWGTFRAPAWVMLGLWLVQQVVMTYFEASADAAVAYSAHTAGFAFGVIVALLLKKTGIDHALDEASSLASERGVWTEHPLYLRALELRDQGDEQQAIAALFDLLDQQTEHVAGREALLQLGFSRSELRCIDLALPPLVEHYHRTQSDRALVELYQELRRVLPVYGLTDTELMRVASAASRVQDFELTIRAITELLEQYPESPLMPRALWTAAEAQARAGGLALQRETLTRIVHRFPEHACATLAREQLGRMAAT